MSFSVDQSRAVNPTVTGNIVAEALSGELEDGSRSGTSGELGRGDS